MATRAVNLPPGFELDEPAAPALPQGTAALPQGFELDSPQGVSPAGMKTAIQAALPPSKSEKFGVGLKDILLGMGQTLMRSPPIEPYSTLNEETDIRERAAAGAPAVDAGIAKREADWQAKRKAGGDTGVEWMREAGHTVALAPLLALLPEIGAGIPGAIATGALQGGFGAGLSPVTSGDYNQGKVGQIGTGAVTGGVVGGVTGGVRSLLAPAPKPPATQNLIDQGVRPTFGQGIGPRAAQLEDKLTSVPGLGDMIKDSQRKAVESFNQAAYKQALDPIGASVEGKVGHDAVRKVGDVLSDAYDAIVPNLKLTPDKQLAQDITEATGIRSRMTASASEQFEKILTDIIPKKGAVEGQVLKDMQSQLTYEIGRFGKSTNPSDQMIADGLEGVRSAIMDNLARSNPAAAERLTAIDKGWANLVRIERAAANTKDGVFTPQGLLAAIKASDDSVRKRGVARGTALMQDFGKQAYELLGERYPDSGSPGRLLTSAAALGFASPKALAAGTLGTIPYLPGLRNMGLTAGPRPAWAKPAAEAIRISNPLLISGLLGIGPK